MSKEIVKAAYRFVNTIQPEINNEIERRIANIAKNSFITGAESQAAKEYHTKGMYTEEEVKKLCSRAFLIKSNNETILEDFEKWTKENL